MSKKFIDINEDNQFALSTGDLMAALLMIFVLLLIGTILKLQEEYDQKSRVAERYEELQVELYNDLFEEFQDDLTVWKAELDSSLAIRFKEPDVLFDGGSAEVKPVFKSYLSEFFPRYLSVLRREKYIEHIEEIRIEGHTSFVGRIGMNEEQSYFFNMELSQDRTRSVLRYCLNTISSEAEDWAIEKVTANGLSSARRIDTTGTIEGQMLNRRVEFKVKTDAEAQIRQMLIYGN